MKRFVWSLVLALGVSTPGFAQFANGVITSSVAFYAGPDATYPTIAQLPAGTLVAIQGCTTGWGWCDVSAMGMRGWVPATFVQYTYQNQPVIVADYGPRIGIPIIGFSINDYWGRYYTNRPFYRNRTYWYNRPYPVQPPRPPVYRPPLRPPVQPIPPTHRPLPANRPPTPANRPPSPVNRPPQGQRPPNQGQRPPGSPNPPGQGGRGPPQGGRPPPQGGNQRPQQRPPPNNSGGNN